MPVPVSLRDVVDHLEMAGPQRSSFLNRVTGELVCLTEDELRAGESDEPTPDLPDWEEEPAEKAREIQASADWLVLPDSFEIHEYRIMERFATSRDGAARDDLCDALRGAGAFRFFRATVTRLGLLDDWYRFRDEALTEIAVSWLEEHGIAFERGPRAQEIR